MEGEEYTDGGISFYFGCDLISTTESIKEILIKNKVLGKDSWTSSKKQMCITVLQQMDHMHLGDICGVLILLLSFIIAYIKIAPEASAYLVLSEVLENEVWGPVIGIPFIILAYGLDKRTGNPCDT